MNDIDQVVNRIKFTLKEQAPKRSLKKENWEKKILNPSDSNFRSYGLKVSQIDAIIRSILEDHELNFEEASQIFKSLINTKIHDEKMAAISFISRFKKDFTDKIIDIYRQALETHCYSWAFCDSSMLKVLGPYLARKGNRSKSFHIIEKWSRSEHLWVRRASLVIYLKLAMIGKDFDEIEFSKLVETLKNDQEEYIEKALAWMIKTCSKYKPNFVFSYLSKNREKFSRSMLRAASQKLPDRLKKKIMQS
jgi:3-methyladenine DNA glycosylase AlkD